MHNLIRRTAWLIATLCAIILVSSAAMAATVTTDKQDYHPGEFVVVTGSGWQPGETVALEFTETPVIHPPEILYAVADGAGNIYNNEYLIQEHDLGQTFTLTATGQTSGLTAQTTFTDATRTDTYPFSFSTFSGGSSYCQNASASNLSVSWSNQTCVGSASGGNTNIPITVTWYKNVSNSTSGGTLVQQNGANANTTTSTYTPPTTATGTIFYYVVVSWNAGANCAPAGSITTSGTQAVTVTSLPTTANAGPDQIACSSGSVTLAANSPSLGTGTWSVFSGPSISSSQFGNVNTPNTAFTPASGAGDYTLRWTITNGSCSNSDDVIITVRPVATATIQVTGANPICPGLASSIKFTGPSDGIVTYNINGGGDLTITLNNGGNFTLGTGALSSTTTYNLVSVKYGTGPDCSQPAVGSAIVTVGTAPSISAHPVSQTKTVGDAVTFSVTASGTGLTYQWRKGGSNITGANSSSYTISSVVLGDAGSYDVVVGGTCGSVTSNVATLTVNPACTPPSFTACPSNLTANTASGTCAAVVTYTVNAAGTLPLTLTYEFSGATTGSGSGTGSGSTFNKGVTNVTVTATNSCSPSPAPTCSFTVTVSDNQPPSITAPLDVNVGTNSGCSYVGSIGTATGSDNCGAVTITNNAPASFPLGPTTVTWTATDGAGLTATAYQVVTVVDDDAPSITTPSNITVSNDPGKCSAVVTFSFSATDNCSGVTVVSSPVSGATFPKGTTTVTITATDGANNQVTSTFTVTVNDYERPLIAGCPSDLTVYTGPTATTCFAVASWTAPTASDNCGVTSFTSNYSPGASLPVGPTTVTYTAKDAANNEATCSFIVTVIDNTPPTLSCPATGTLTAVAGAGCQVAVPAVNVNASDNCSVASTIQTPAAGTMVGLGSTSITVTVKDAANNTVSCATDFTVTNNPPVITGVTGPSAPLPWSTSGVPVNITVNFTDDAGQGHTCTFAWDDGSSTTVAGSSGSGSGTASHTYNSGAGVYSIVVTVTDACGATATSQLYVVVYDPNAGFVTGGGWINSPPGAYTDDPSLTGKANFGFVSKYQKGKTVPTGETQFQFQMGNLNFHSTVYEWLVVSGAKAQYKGSGTINGAGSYKFLLTATDGQVNGGGGIDKFRIKITNGAIVVYDNVPGALDDIDAANPQVIGGGSIVIHTGGTKKELGEFIPLEYALYQNYPNPFNPSTQIMFDLPEDSKVSVTIYDLLGRAVVTLVNEERAAGRFEETWQGKNAAGSVVASGMYFLRIEAKSLSSTRSLTSMKKMLMVK